MRVFILILFITLTLFADRALQLKKMQHEGRVALVIGNAAYKEQPLKNPLNDAWAVKNALEERNFQVFYLENGSRRLMVQTIDRFIHALERSSIGLVYYAGHGVEVHGENFLIPVGSDIETETDIKYEAISMSRLIDDMQMTQSRLNIFVMDACRNNPYRETTRGGDSGGLANVEAEGFFIAFATSPGKVAKDGTGKHGLFTNYFLKYIKKEGMPLREVFHNVRQNVYRESHREQLPLVRNGIGMGEFYFTLQKIILEPTKTSTTPEFTKNIATPIKKPEKYSLSVNVIPENSHIYITNIKPKYTSGMHLSPGTYYLKIIASGYKTLRYTVDLTQDTDINLELKKISKPIVVQNNPKVIQEDGYWFDPKTQLTWQDSIQKTSIINWTDAIALPWENAKEYCDKLHLGRYSDWRLPSLYELFSIVDYKRYQPAIKRAIKNVAGGFYWTSSAVIPDTSGFFSNMFGSSNEKVPPTQAWVIYFLDGSSESATFETDGHVRCVRGAK
jgi:hypothetical protein